MSVDTKRCLCDHGLRPFVSRFAGKAVTVKKPKWQQPMRHINLLALVVLSLSLGSVGGNGQSYDKTNPIDGQWTYRSFRNSTDLINGDAAKALALIFGEGIFTFETPSPGSLRGTLDMGGGYVLDIEGTVRPEPKAENYTVVAAVMDDLAPPRPVGSTTTMPNWPTVGQTASTRSQRCSAV